MVSYDFFHYIYPPRPENPVNPTELDSWDDGMLIAQPKLNGSNMVLFMDGTNCFTYNRHAERMSNVQVDKSEFMELYQPFGWMVLNGEYLNKSKSDENGQVFNHKFVIFDILVHQGQYLVGTTFAQRIKLLDDLFGQNPSDKDYLFQISENIYRVKSYDAGFRGLFNNLTKIDMVEGLVCKRKSGKLEVGSSQKNTTKSQIKFRKPTKNYKY